MSLFNHLLLSPPKCNGASTSSWVSGPVFSKWTPSPLKANLCSESHFSSSAVASVSSSLFNGVSISSGISTSAAWSPPAPRAVESCDPGEVSVKKKTLSAAEAEALIPVYLEDTVRDSTKKQYRSYFLRYKTFCHENFINIHDPKSISMFLIVLSESSKGKSAALLAKNAIKHNLKLLSPFKKSPTDNYFISRILKSINKKFSKPVKKAKCIDSDMIFKLVKSLLSEKSFKADRAAVFFLLQFTICGRFEEVAKLKLCNLSFLPSGHLEVKVEQAKNFENWDSQCSYVAKNTEGNFDPLAVITPYYNFLVENNSKWLFPNFRLAKGKKIKILDVHVSYGNMLQQLQSSLTKIGFEGKTFSLHSVRTGSLSEAANSEKVSKSDLQRHTRWKSPSMVQYYHKLSLNKKLSVSRSLKLYSF